jgi:hydroxymethylbilane synthase
LDDIPVDVPEGFVIAAIEAREDARDALVSNRHATLAELPQRAVVGASSLACEAQLRERYPALNVQPMRGSLFARFRALDAGELDAMIVPACSIRRVGHADRIRELLDPAASLPAPGQGALALQCRADRADILAVLEPVIEFATSLATIAERAFARALSGNRHTPLAAHATWQEGTLWLRGLIARRDGRQVLRGEREAPALDADAAAALGSALADDLLARGAARLILND